MFGYIKPDSGELKVRQFELYKSIYCGICKTGGKTVSRLTRFILSYDFVFMAALRLVFTQESYTLEAGRCVYNPLKRKNIMAKNDALIFTASAFAVLSYFSFVDDINDSKGLKKFFKKIALPFLSPMKRKALKHFPALEEIIKPPLAELSNVESQSQPSVDEAADCFARLVSRLLSFGLTDANARIAENCGYHLGRYIYIIDACDDLDDDVKTGNFNPLKSIYKDKEAMIKQPDHISATLTDSMNAFLLSYSLHDRCDDDLDSIAMNIAVLGTAKTQREILYKVKER